MLNKIIINDGLGLYNIYCECVIRINGDKAVDMIYKTNCRIANNIILTFHHHRTKIPMIAVMPL